MYYIKVLSLSLGLEPDIFTLQANSQPTVLLTVNDKLLNVSIHFETDSGPVESESSQTETIKLDLQPSVSTTDTQQNIEPPYPDIAKLTVMDDTVK
jgi:hypothetical protein